ncbi:tripartite tricarboxylate transporter TctB family protein [Hoeflea sp. YIM 152468]|uniref:tripartite tricarboxylate transporter TctB family protein n=1 Tax=Hoeflea sp. YIM 152468 TaxID=3031759 RepID=UPI0023DAE215|nr:tripartite tricarboxylate transporter TctB family protein [Hoeflea sp. YIM 152468]MDF1609061.1 tripartite tricarboxylate transporter TctB family protein [Hoeflea sp. YIM 152468]
MLSRLRTLVLPRRRSFMVSVFAMLVGAAYLYWEATQLPASILKGYPGDGFFPRIALAVILVCGIATLIREAVSKQLVTPPAPEHTDIDAADDDKDAPINLDAVEAFLIVALSLLYMLLLKPLGLEIATSLFMFVLLFPRLPMRWPKAALIAALGAVATTLVVYSAFVLGLKVALPLKFLPQYLSGY